MNWFQQVWRWPKRSMRARRRSKWSSSVTAIHAEPLEHRALLTISIQFDYRYDASHFFDAADRKAALEAAGHLVADQLTDSLAAIQPTGTNRWTPSVVNPATGATVSVAGTTSVAANTILVFAGARNISNLGIGGPGGFSASGTTAWLNGVRSRGQSGAVSTTNPTDTAPWGGSITFDSSGVNWSFGLTTSSLTSTQTDFVSVAVHELTHVIGFVSNNKAFTRNINANGKFVGANAVAANGGAAVPMDATRGHWRDGLQNDGLETAMDPSLTVGARKLLTSLDRASLKDMGWTLSTSDDTAYIAAHKLTHTTAGLTNTFTTIASIDSSTDVDLFRIWAKSGTTLTITLSPGVGFNSAMRLFDQSGRELSRSNNGTAGTADTLTFTLTSSDFYYVGISSSGRLNYNPLRTGQGSLGTLGTYQLSVSMS